MCFTVLLHKNPISAVSLPVCIWCMFSPLCALYVGTNILLNGAKNEVANILISEIKSDLAFVKSGGDVGGELFFFSFQRAELSIESPFLKKVQVAGLPVYLNKQCVVFIVLRPYIPRRRISYSAYIRIRI